MGSPLWIASGFRNWSRTMFQAQDASQSQIDAVRVSDTNCGKACGERRGMRKTLQLCLWRRTCATNPAISGIFRILSQGTRALVSNGG